MLPREEQAFVHSSDVMCRVLDGEAVLLDLTSGKYLGLNDVGTRVWELIGEGKPYGAIRGALLAEFDVEAAVLEHDLGALLADMQTRALIRAL